MSHNLELMLCHVGRMDITIGQMFEQAFQIAVGVGRQIPGLLNTFIHEGGSLWIRKSDTIK